MIHMQNQFCLFFLAVPTAKEVPGLGIEPKPQQQPGCLTLCTTRELPRITHFLSGSPCIKDTEEYRQCLSYARWGR